MASYMRDAYVTADPDNWMLEPQHYNWVIPNFLKDRAAIAHQAGKPIIMEASLISLGSLYALYTLLNCVILLDS